MHIDQFIQCVTVILAQIFDKIRLIEKIRHIFRRKQHLKQCCIAVFIHIFNAGLHILVLFLFICFGLSQGVFCSGNLAVQDLNLHLCRRDLIAQGQDFLVNALQFIFKGRGLVLKALNVVIRISGKDREHNGKRAQQCNTCPAPSLFEDFHNLDSFLCTQAPAIRCPVSTA